jgi:hypothetical protein
MMLNNNHKIRNTLIIVTFRKAYWVSVVFNSSNPVLCIFLYAVGLHAQDLLTGSCVSGTICHVILFSLFNSFLTSNAFSIRDSE